MAAYMEKEGTDLISRAGDVLKDACSEASKQTFKMDSDKIFFRGKLSTKMSVYTVSIDTLKYLDVLFSARQACMITWMPFSTSPFRMLENVPTCCFCSPTH
jgi:hypothetical protein